MHKRCLTCLKTQDDLNTHDLECWVHLPVCVHLLAAVCGGCRVGTKPVQRPASKHGRCRARPVRQAGDQRQQWVATNVVNAEPLLWTPQLASASTSTSTAPGNNWQRSTCCHAATR